MLGKASKSTQRNGSNALNEVVTRFRSTCYCGEVYAAPLARVFKSLTLVTTTTLSPQLFYRTIDMVVKQGFSAFWWWSQSGVPQYLRRPLENFKGPLCFSKHFKNWPLTVMNQRSHRKRIF